MARQYGQSARLFVDEDGVAGPRQAERGGDALLQPGFVGGPKVQVAGRPPGALGVGAHLLQLLGELGGRRPLGRVGRRRGVGLALLEERLQALHALQAVAALDVDDHFGPEEAAQQQQFVEGGPGQVFGRLVQREDGVAPAVQLRDSGGHLPAGGIPAEGAVDETLGEGDARRGGGGAGPGARFELPRIPALEEQPGDAVVVERLGAPAQPVEGRRQGPRVGQQLGGRGLEARPVVGESARGRR